MTDEKKRMDIYSKPGTRVIFDNLGGYDAEQEAALKHLKIGESYTIKETEVHSFSTTVYLEECPEILFNSVQFAAMEAK